ncbi:hypothetical protein GCM10023318_29940 [Nocardia callitridis]|uniref:Uncharacterized protein n=1 Tax=Nocardia callitridis TaxID=648753 RepID=A0ABP9KF68_9NOCA
MSTLDRLVPPLNANARTETTGRAAIDHASKHRVDRRPTRAGPWDRRSIRAGWYAHTIEE